MKDILDLKIKWRESFRPFAPPILKEHAGEWFEEVDDVPFMMQLFQIREGIRPQIPAVTHVDGSGRQQTGVPMVLNTSFNENEPLPCRPKEALGCFLRTKMDEMVLSEALIRRGDAAA